MDFSPARSITNPRLAISPRVVDWLGFGALTLLALVVFARYDLLNAPLSHDMSLQMYGGQLISQGQPLYVKLGLVKTPLAPIYSAFAILLGNALGLWDVLAVRYAFWLAMAVGAGGIYLWVRHLFQSRSAGMVAALAFLMLDVVGRSSVLGPQPKTLVVLAAIFCLYSLARARWFAAGICAALAFLAWQPAGLLMPIALAAPLLDPFKQRRREFLFAALGVALPLVLVLVYLLAQGALVAAFQDTFGANVAYLQNTTGQAGLMPRLTANLQRITMQRGQHCYANPLTLTWSLVGLASALGAGALALVSRKRAFLSRAYFPILAYTILFFGFTLLDFQVCDDLLPFAPIYALGAGALVFVAQRVVSKIRAAHAQQFARYAGSGLLAIFVALLVFTLPPPAARKMTLEKQVAVAAHLAPYLQDDDEIQQLGDAGLLVFLHRRNTTKLIFFGPKTGTGVLQQIPGGIDTIIQQLDDRPPRLVALSHVRLKAAPWFRDLQVWLNANYKELGTYEMYSGRSPNVQVWIHKKSK